MLQTPHVLHNVHDILDSMESVQTKFLFLVLEPTYVRLCQA